MNQPPRDPSSLRADDLTDPSVDVDTLRHIAAVRPDLRPAVLQHPNCDPELTGFIAQQLRAEQPSAAHQWQSQAGPQQPWAGQPAQGQPQPVDPSNEKVWGIFMHLGALLFLIFAPLIIWLVYKDRSEVLNQQGRAALNWHLSYVIYSIVSWVLMFVFIGWITWVALIVLDIIFSILAAVKASERRVWKYPLSIPFFKVRVNV